MSQQALFTPVTLGSLTLPHRAVMAPMTRNRAGEGQVPTPLMAEHYAQRASAALITDPATFYGGDARGYTDSPALGA